MLVIFGPFGASAARTAGTVIAATREIAESAKEKRRILKVVELVLVLGEMLRSDEPAMRDWCKLEGSRA
jgi:hypothetical protein